MLCSDILSPIILCCQELPPPQRLSCSKATTPGTCEPGLISQGWGMLPRGEAWGGRVCLGPAGTRILTQNQPAVAREKTISGGPLPCSSIRKGVPLMEGRTGGSSSGEDGTEGSTGCPQLRPVTRTPAPGV